MAALVERRYVSPPILAKEWGVAAKKVITLIHSGELRAINLATDKDKRPRYAIDRADVQQFEQSRLVVPGPPVGRVRRKPTRKAKDYFPES